MSSFTAGVSNFFVRELHHSKYRLLGLVGQGQFGRVYCASHRKTGRLVALKELNRDRFSTHKFLRELRFLLSLQHENIVTCHTIEQTATGRYLVMDYCEAGTLRNLLKDEVRLHPMQGLNLITQILAGLDHAHQKGIVHCDIKPENILLTAHTHGWTARISDFGIARLSQELASQEFSNTGSPAYMAPERFYGQYSIASDLYAVGVLLFEVLVGHRPFSGLPSDLMSAHLNQTVQIPASVPPELQPIIRQALQKLPARRFRSAKEMLELLQAAIVSAEIELSRGWAASTLVCSHDASTPSPFHQEYEEILDTPIQQLVNIHPLGQVSHAATTQFQAAQFFRVYGNRVGCQVYQEKWAEVDSEIEPLHHPPVSMSRVRLRNMIVKLVVQADGCFAITQQAVYWLSGVLFQKPAQETALTNNRVATASIPQLVTEFKHQVMIAIAPGGRWMATANSSSGETVNQIHLWNLRHLNPIQTSIPLKPTYGFQLLALDSRHLALFSHTTDRDCTCITGMQINLFSRRGTEAGQIRLPIPLRNLITTLMPYRLLATEPNYPNSLLLLDLKPLRIQRIGLDIAPTLMAIASWGYAMISREGQIVLLDQLGQLVGRMNGPAHPTALSFVLPHQLVIATWDGTQGHLYGVNLRHLELDVLF